MGFKRFAWAAARQVLLFGCGAGVLAAARAGMVACAAVLALAALWIAAAAAWQARLRPAAPAPKPPAPGPKMAEAELLASLLDQTPAPLITRDASGRLLARNRAARRLFATDGPLLSPPPSLVDAMASQPAPGRATVEVATDADWRTYALSLSEMVTETGPLRLAALLDIEPELRAAEAAALRELLGVLSHEIMNGLTPVASLASTARDLLTADTAEARADVADALMTLERRAEGLARFADGYRTLARLPPPVRRPVSLAALVAEAAKLFRARWAGRGVTLTTEVPSPDLQAMLDADQVLQALMNLLANGAEAALEGGRAPQVRLQAAASVGGVLLRVEDNGAGVAPELRDRIGQPFFTTKALGTGVGLSLARQVARAHGGDLELHPDPGLEGATFTLLLSA